MWASHLQAREGQPPPLKGYQFIQFKLPPIPQSSASFCLPNHFLFFFAPYVLRTSVLTFFSSVSSPDCILIPTDKSYTHGLDPSTERWGVGMRVQFGGPGPQQCDIGKEGKLQVDWSLQNTHDGKFFLFTVSTTSPNIHTDHHHLGESLAVGNWHYNLLPYHQLQIEKLIKSECKSLRSEGQGESKAFVTSHRSQAPVFL